MTAASLLRAAGRSTVTCALVLFAVWTIVYQVALFAGFPATPSLVVALVLGVGSLVLGRRLDPTAPPLVAALPGSTPSLAVLGVTVVATGLALVGQRSAALVIGVLAAIAALVTVARKPQPADTSTAADEHVPGPWLWPVGWGAAVVSAVLASIVVRPDGDDAYFVNFSTWVAERGRFPLRETMISPDRLPALSAHSPPTHSVEGLIGAVARVGGIEAGTAAYVVATPLVTALAVLVLTRLVEEARVPTAPAALLAAVTYLWTTGGSSYSFGSFFGVRMWQGKAMLVSLVLPLVLLTGARLVRSGSARSHLLFGAALVAAVGVSNTSVFLLPLLVGGIAVAAVALHRPRGALRLAAWVAYPLVVGVLTVLAAPESSTTAQRLAEGFVVSQGGTGGPDPLTTVPGSYGILAVTCLAIGLGALGIRDLVLRVATTGSFLATGVCLLPGVRSLLATIGLDSVLWRFWWIVPVPLLLAGFVGAVTGRLAERPRVVVAAAAAATAALVGLTPLANGQWVGAPGNGAYIATPLTWKVPRDALREARFVESISRPGDTVVAPWDTSRVLVALTVDVQPVSARSAYLPYYSGVRGAYAGARRELQLFADERTPEGDPLTSELDALSVDTACVGSTRGRAISLLKANGFHRAGEVNDLTCLRR